VRRAARPLHGPDDLDPLLERVGDARIVLLGEASRGTSEHNAARSMDAGVGFYGLDVYSLWASLAEIMRYLERVDPDALEAAREAVACFEPYGRGVQAYAHATAFVPDSCEDEVVELLATVRRRTADLADDHEAAFDAEQNARAAVGAERYYRAMLRADADSWTVRDRHMVGTLEALMAHHGPDAKAIVWEHNTHIGDARATDMAAAGMVNAGQLTRERYGRDDVLAVGFGSRRSSVIAGRYWGADFERMPVPPAQAGSWEDVFHTALAGDGPLLTGDLSEAAEERRGHRAIGVVYDPDAERFGNYVPSRLKARYDAFVFLDATQALHPLRPEAEDGRPPDLYPWGVCGRSGAGAKAATILDGWRSSRCCCTASSGAGTTFSSRSPCCGASSCWR